MDYEFWREYDPKEAGEYLTDLVIHPSYLNGKTADPVAELINQKERDFVYNYLRLDWVVSTTTGNLVFTERKG